MRFPASIVLALAFLWGTPLVRAQEVAQDSVQTVAYGTEMTLRAMLQQSQQLRRIPSTAAVNPAGTDPFLGIGQLVVDETISRTGSYFYDVFYRLWRPPSGARFVSVVLSEQPLPGQGTLVSVRLDGELVFQSRLSPREEDAETLAQQAVGFTLRRLPQGDG